MANAMISALRGNNNEAFTYMFSGDPGLVGSSINVVKFTSGISELVPNQNFVVKEAKSFEELRLIAKSEPNSIIKLVLPDGQISKLTYDELLKIIGPAGEGHEWEHLVEQSSTAVYGALQIQNTDNILSIPTWLHTLKSARYSTKDHTLSEILTVRKWVEQNLAYSGAIQYAIDTITSFLEKAKLP